MRKNAYLCKENMNKLVRFLKDWTLPVAIAVGTVCYLTFYYVPQLDALGDTLGGIVDIIFPWMVFYAILDILPHRLPPDASSPLAHRHHCHATGSDSIERLAHQVCGG